MLSLCVLPVFNKIFSLCYALNGGFWASILYMWLVSSQCNVFLNGTLYSHNVSRPKSIIGYRRILLQTWKICMLQVIFNNSTKKVFGIGHPCGMNAKEKVTLYGSCVKKKHLCNSDEANVFMCRLYATKVMIGCVESELGAMRNGLHDVIPSELLSSLTPEVSRLPYFQQYQLTQYCYHVYCMKCSIYVYPIREKILGPRKPTRLFPCTCDKGCSVKVKQFIFRYFHILFRTFSCCCQVAQQMWTSIVFVLSSHSATVMAVQLIYSTDSNGE